MEYQKYAIDFFFHFQNFKLYMYENILKNIKKNTFLYSTDVLLSMYPFQKKLITTNHKIIQIIRNQQHTPKESNSKKILPVHDIVCKRINYSLISSLIE